MNVANVLGALLALSIIYNIIANCSDVSGVAIQYASEMCAAHGGIHHMEATLYAHRTVASCKEDGVKIDVR